jgi:hypothetical protein
MSREKAFLTEGLFYCSFSSSGLMRPCAGGARFQAKAIGVARSVTRVLNDGHTSLHPKQMAWKANR